MAAKEVKQNPIAQGISFAKEAWAELKKVHPPSKDETIKGTVGVLVMVLFFGIFLGLADWIVGMAMQWIWKLA